MGASRGQRFTSEGVVEKKDKNTIHPVWRGVGILLMVLIPVMGYVGALMVLEANRKNSWFRIPGEVLVPGPDNLILVKVILTIVIGAAVYFLFMMVTFIIFRIAAPPKLGPKDAPPVQWKTKDKS
jgi:quinol-cytochrome oxidoreductase complex cytochrome b subunit